MNLVFKSFEEITADKRLHDKPKLLEFAIKENGTLFRVKRDHGSMVEIMYDDRTDVAIGGKPVVWAKSLFDIVLEADEEPEFTKPVAIVKTVDGESVGEFEISDADWEDLQDGWRVEKYVGGIMSGWRVAKYTRFTGPNPDNRRIKIEITVY